MNEIEGAIDHLDDVMLQLGGCGDGGCIIVKPKGMHTNGGCRCSTNRLKMERFAYEHNRFVSSVSAARNAIERELGDVSSAIRTVMFMDHPDGGDVTLAEQVRRMRVMLAEVCEEAATYLDFQISAAEGRDLADAKRFVELQRIASDLRA